MTTYCPRCGEDTYHTHQQAEDADYAFIEGAVLSASGANDELARNLQTRLGRIQGTIYGLKKQVDGLVAFLGADGRCPQPGSKVEVARRIYTRTPGGGSSSHTVWRPGFVLTVDLHKGFLAVQYQPDDNPDTPSARDELDLFGTSWRWPGALTEG